MRKAIQELGSRKWWGNQLQDLQAEPLAAIEDAIMKSVGNCVLSPVGFTGGGNLNGAGYVYLFDSAGTNGKVCRVPAATLITPSTCYLVQGVLDRTDNADYGDVYDDGATKDIINEYVAVPQATPPAHSNYIYYNSGVTTTPTFQEAIIERFPGLYDSREDVTAADFDNDITPGKYYKSSGAANNPTGTAGTLIVTRKASATEIIQQVFVDVLGQIRTRTKSGSWGSWVFESQYFGGVETMVADVTVETADGEVDVFAFTPDADNNHRMLRVFGRLNVFCSITTRGNYAFDVKVKKAGVLVDTIRIVQFLEREGAVFESMLSYDINTLISAYTANQEIKVTIELLNIVSTDDEIVIQSAYSKINYTT